MALIELRDVVVDYGGLRALDGVTCSVEGGVVGLLGPNGAGKSTLIKTLLGFNRAASGTVTLFGKTMPRQALEIRQFIGYMPEREVVSPKVSAVGFLTYLGRLFGMSHVDAMERTHEVLNYVSLGESRYRKMETYSTGMLQRVKLAQALLHDPTLLLLDEPTNGLDPEGRIEVLDLIADVASRREVCVLLSSHLLPDVQHVCERVIMINRGQIVEEGSIEALTVRRERQYELRVRENRQDFVAALEAAGCVCTKGEQDMLLVTQPEGASPRMFFEAARAQQTQIRHFQAAHTSLAEVFMTAMEKDGAGEAGGIAHAHS